VARACLARIIAIRATWNCRWGCKGRDACRREGNDADRGRGCREDGAAWSMIRRRSMMNLFLRQCACAVLDAFPPRSHPQGDSIITRRLKYCRLVQRDSYDLSNPLSLSLSLSLYIYIYIYLQSPEHLLEKRGDQSRDHADVPLLARACS